MISMKDAKTGQEMLDSWQNLVGDGDIEDIKNVFRVYADKIPELLEHFTNKPLLNSLERGALDPKTRELVLIAMLAAKECGPGVVFHIQGAIHEGATEKEILEVIFLSAYESCKCNAAALGQSVEEGFRRASSMKDKK